MDTFFKLLSRHRLLAHGLYWLLFFLYEVAVCGSLDDQYAQRAVTSLIELPLKMAALYITLYWLIDRFLVTRKYRQFVILLLLSMLFFGLLQRSLAYFVIYPMYAPDGLKTPLFFFPKIVIYSVIVYACIGIPAMVHLTRLWYEQQQRWIQLQQTTEQLAKDKLEAELKLLKSQIHPHFLFNTLNNLYALTVSQSSKAPEIVYKLSELMSYMLYDSNLPAVPLIREIQYIENYITLEKIRYGDRLDVSLNVYNSLETIRIAPLIILPFVENSFKHGVSHQLDRVWVRVDVLTNDNVLIIKVENSKVPGESSTASYVHSGIGLQNVRKRLDIIYGRDYSLQLFNEPETYLVVLKIALQPALLPVELHQSLSYQPS